MPLVHAEVDVEAVGDRVPRHLPVHAFLQALDVRLGCARSEHERGITGVQMGDMSDLICDEGTANARMFRPAVHTGLEKRAVDDQLMTTFEEVEQPGLTVRAVEFVLLLNG